jgi:hypothetical protein
MLLIIHTGTSSDSYLGTIVRRPRTVRAAAAWTHRENGKVRRTNRDAYPVYEWHDVPADRIDGDRVLSA